jgi:carbamoyl-phosphate synthase large subunit
VVVKIPKWPFDKFETDTKLLGTRMMATGETMAIGSNFEQALLKAIRSLEIGRYSLHHKQSKERTLDELKNRIIHPDDERIFDIAEMLRRKYSMDRIAKLTGIDEFFIKKIKGIVECEEELAKMKPCDLSSEHLRKLKKLGFADRGIADIMSVKEDEIFNLRKKYNIIPTYKLVDTCAAEFEAVSPYYYSTYDEYDESVVSNNKKVVVIGSGPIRIGQGIEFDYCCVHSVFTLRKQGIEAIVINNNPETVSTDFDISDKLYFEPLTEEDFYNIIEKEKPDGVIFAVRRTNCYKTCEFLYEKEYSYNRHSAKEH